MNPGIRISLEGTPESVQLLADITDRALPNVITWRDLAICSNPSVIKVNGTGVKVITLRKKKISLSRYFVPTTDAFT